MRISDWSSDVCSSDLILTPQAIPNLLVSVDYYKIKVDNYIGPVDPFLTINQCIQTGNPFFCDLYNRDPATGVIFGNNGYNTATTLNTGHLISEDRREGKDVSICVDRDGHTLIKQNNNNIPIRG